MNVLSLFDGLSGGQIALNRAGIKYDQYFASEIDKHAIKVTQYHYPNTVQLGDVCNIKGYLLPKIDLLLGGSPCQGFSIAGKGLNFEDPRSKLFFEYVRILNELRETNPSVKFLLENVRMKEEWRNVITEHLGVEPIFIDSALVSAQTRKRLYWTNIEGVTQPEDRGLILQDILEDGVVDRQKSFCLDASYFKGGNLKQYFEKNRRQLVFQINEFTNREYALKLLENGNLRAFQNDERKSGLSEVGTITHIHNKSFSVIASHAPKVHDYFNVRKLTPLECERLQTVPDGYTAASGVSNSQRYKMLGNGWTVDVIVHILSFLSN